MQQVIQTVPPEAYHELASGRPADHGKIMAGCWNLLNPASDAGAFITTNNGKFDPHYQALYVYDGTADVTGTQLPLKRSSAGLGLMVLCSGGRGLAYLHFIIISVLASQPACKYIRMICDDEISG